MSVIFKCDRCKEVIDRSEMAMFMRYGVDELKQFEDLDTPVTAYTAYTCLLCNECKDAFSHFLLNLKADIPLLEEENKQLKDVIRRIYIETTTDHYGNAYVTLENIDKILSETENMWS